MNHLSERDLAFLTAGEEPAAPIREHLDACPLCRGRFDEIQATLLLVSGSEKLPERGDSYGRDVWSRVAPRLPERRAFVWPTFLAPRRLAFAGVCALVLIATFLAGRFWRVAQPTPLSAAVKERVLVIALGEHLERSQAVLIELANAPGTATVDVSSEQARASDLVAANRLYRQTASQAGDRAVSAVLEELERVLLDVAHGPSQLTPADLAALRQRIEEKGVLFKVRVIGSNLRERGELPGPGALERKRT
ncbi:MAG TPA: hypothetical protein VGK86_14740 [Thermoanaerobaculia bacterium]|jgi:hypothetical protein